MEKTTPTPQQSRRSAAEGGEHATAFTKISGGSTDLLAENIAKLKELFPEVFAEGKIDFDALKQLLGEYVDDANERYSFTWNGKAQARRIAQTPSMGTLRPCPDESVNWDTTRNLFLEGDNLEVLKLLQKSYYKKIKMIYIDPPYNTGKEFIYPDNFRDSIKNYMELTGQTDGEGRKLSTNPETSGRYHTDWLNMMYPRLKLARNLLREDGVIFISIDDHEVDNLRKLCNEIFGEENFVATIIWQKVFGPKNTARHFSEDHDYVVLYARNAEAWRPDLLPRTEEQDAAYRNPDSDPRGPWKPSDLVARNYYSKGVYPVTSPGGRVFEGPRPGTYWRVPVEKFRQLDAENRIWWGSDGNAAPMMKRFRTDVMDGRVPQTFWRYEDVGHTKEAKEQLMQSVAFESSDNVVDSVKPPRLIQRALQVSTTADEGDVVLDFFAGTGTTAHGVLLQNQQDGGNRQFIVVQLPEPLPKPETKLKTIADIGKERIRRVIKKIQAEQAQAARQATLPGMDGTPKALDLGFKVFKLDSSNIKAWDPDFNQLEHSLLSATEVIKPERTEADVLYEILLKYGLDLTLPLEKRELDGKTAHIIGGGSLVICLAQNMTLAVVEKIAALKDEFKPETPPGMRVVFKDAGFANDELKTNAVQILKQRGIEDVRAV